MSTYFIFDPKTNLVKIGQSSKPKNRIKGLQTATASDLILLGCINGSEYLAHQKFNPLRVRHDREWFHMSVNFLHVIENQTLHVIQTRYDRVLIYKTTEQETYYAIVDGQGYIVNSYPSNDEIVKHLNGSGIKLYDSYDFMGEIKIFATMSGRDILYPTNPDWLDQSVYDKFFGAILLGGSA